MLTLHFKRLHLIALVLLVAGGVFAAVASGPFAIFAKLQSYLGGGVYVGTSSIGSTTNKVTQVLYAGQSFNFDAGQAGDVRWGPAVTVTGAAMGDQCLISSDFGNLGTGDVLNCYVAAANTVNFSLTTTKTNNDPGDAGFYIRVISNQ